jgi:hypothetical protein
LREKLSGPFLKYGHVFVGRYREEIPPSPPLEKGGTAGPRSDPPSAKGGRGDLALQGIAQADFLHLFVTVFPPQTTKCPVAKIRPRIRAHTIARRARGLSLPVFVVNAALISVEIPVRDMVIACLCVLVVGKSPPSGCAPAGWARTDVSRRSWPQSRGNPRLRA